MRLIEERELMSRPEVLQTLGDKFVEEITRVEDVVRTHGFVDEQPDSIEQRLKEQIIALKAAGSVDRLKEVVSTIMADRTAWAAEEAEEGQVVVPLPQKLVNARDVLESLIHKEAVQQDTEAVIQNIRAITDAIETIRRIDTGRKRLSDETERAWKAFQETTRKAKVMRRKWSPMKVIRILNDLIIDEPPRTIKEIHDGHLTDAENLHGLIEDVLARTDDEDIVKAFDALKIPKAAFTKGMTTAEKKASIERIKAALEKKIAFIEALLAEQDYVHKTDRQRNAADGIKHDSTVSARSRMKKMHDTMVGTEPHGHFIDNASVRIKGTLKRSSRWLNWKKDLSQKEIDQITLFYERDFAATAVEIREATRRLRDKIVADNERICGESRTELSQRFVRQMDAVARTRKDIFQQMSPVAAVFIKKLAELQVAVRKHTQARVQMNALIQYLESLETAADDALPKLADVKPAVLDASNEAEIKALEGTVVEADVNRVMAKVQSHFDAVVGAGHYTGANLKTRLAGASAELMREALAESERTHEDYTAKLTEVSEYFKHGCLETVAELQSHWSLLLASANRHVVLYGEATSAIATVRAKRREEEKKLAEIEKRFTNMDETVDGSLGKRLKEKMYTEDTADNVEPGFHTRYTQGISDAVASIDRIKAEALALSKAAAAPGAGSRPRLELKRKIAEQDRETDKLKALEVGTMLDEEGQIVPIPAEIREKLENGEEVPGIEPETYGIEAARKYYEDKYTAEFRAELDIEKQQIAERMIATDHELERLLTEQRVAQDRAMLLGSLLQQQNAVILGLMAVNYELEAVIGRSRDAMKSKVFESLGHIVKEKDQSAMRKLIADKIAANGSTVNFNGVDELKRMLGSATAPALTL